MKKIAYLASLAFLIALPFAVKAQWAPKTTPIYTKWSKNFNYDNPLPEYPRPQMARTDWQNLNGYWEFKSGGATDVVPHGQTLGGQVVVPFPIESTLSKVVKHYERVWYRRTFTVPANWAGKRIIMHFGAVDWESEVFINGTSMGIHKGGFDAFSYDITDKLTGSGEQEVIVRVYDPTRDYGQPRGKQTTAPGGAMYTCVTGIWQTVWLEPVSNKSISNLKLVPDVDKGLLNVTVQTPDSSGLTVTATAKDGDKVIATVTGKLNELFTIPVPSAKLWSPESPFLYDLTLVVKQGNVKVDSVSSYFGMRKISRSKVGNDYKLLLNNKFVFQMGPLDQGFWPEGIYTAPTDEALKSDIEQEKALGFNMVRKHIKVEPQRWYYWADKLGILVWQDMPSANSYDTPAGVTTDQAAHELEMREMIAEHISSPSIIMWVLFNEGCGQFDTKGRVDLCRSLDPSRLVDQGSGGMVATPVSAGDVIDAHRYPDPLGEKQPNQASVSGEYGGIVLKISGHQWGAPSTYPDHAMSASELLMVYSSLADQVINLKTNYGLSAAVYTQITDVEEEINGIMTYDRMMKADINKFRSINEKIINQDVASVIDVLPTSQSTGQSWKYTTTTPSASWSQSTFDDTAWKTGMAGFGALNPPGSVIRTPWTTSDIWMRRKFTVTDVDKSELSKIAIKLYHDENCDIYINGVLAGSANGYNSEYGLFFLNVVGKRALITNGQNTIAIRCHQTGGGQYIDAGLVKIVMTGDTTAAYNPKPVTAATEVNTNLTLSWTPGFNSKSHNVYLGTSSTLTEADLLGNQTGTSRVVDNLKDGTTYYWRVDEVTDGSLKTGYLWSFRTKAASGISDLSDKTSGIYPNPLRKGELLTVALGSDFPEINQLELLASDGSVVFGQVVKGERKLSLNLSAQDLAAGIYFIRTKRNDSWGKPEKLVLIP